MDRRTIRVISPVIANGRGDDDETLSLSTEQLAVEHVWIEEGPASVECEVQHALSVPGTLRRVVEAEADGVDAIVISCMEDPGLRPARELARIPVLGTLETSSHLASMLGHRFSIVTTDEYAVPAFEERVGAYALTERLASVRYVDIGVLALDDDRQATIDGLVEQSIRAVREDRAHVIVFGCTGMTGCAAAVADGLAAAGIDDVPVIDPVPATVNVASALLAAGLSHSKRTFGTRNLGPISGYEFLAAHAAAR